MGHDYIPRRDAAFGVWSANFSARIGESPGVYGLTAAQAGAYAGLHAVFEAALQTAVDPGTRTAVSVEAKNAARRAVEREARRLARIVQATPGVTDAQRTTLGLTVRDAVLTPSAVPSEPPHMALRLLHDSTVRLTLRGRGSTRRGRPEGVAGAVVFSYVGETPPDLIDAWTFAGTTTRMRMDITFGPGIEPGARVWLTAYWTNPRAERGPLAAPQYTHIQCPSLMLPKPQRLRLAA